MAFGISGISELAISEDSGSLEDLGGEDGLAVLSTQLRQIEVLTDWRCNGAVRKCTLPYQSCVVEYTLENGMVVPRVTVTAPVNTWQAAEVLPRRIFLLVFQHPVSLAVTYEEFRIGDDHRSSNTGRMATYRGYGPILELAKKLKPVTKVINGVAQRSFTETNRTPTQLLTDYIIPAAPTYFTLGTITPASPQDTRFENDNPLSGSLKVLEGSNRVASYTLQTEYWLSARANGTSGFFLDITILNISATRPKIMTGRSLQGLEMLKSSVPQANRVHMVGEDGATIGENMWQVDTVPDGTHIRVKDINGGRGLTNETDQVDNLYWFEEDGSNVSHLITGSTKISDTITELTMASTAGIVADDWGSIRMNAAGDDVAYLDTPSKQTTEVLFAPLLVPRFDRYVNIFKNPDLNEVSGVDPKFWDRTGVAPTQKTGAGEWLHGGKSWELNGTPSVLEQIRDWYVREDGFAWYWVWLYYTVANPTIEFQYQGISLPGSPWTMTQANLFSPATWIVWPQRIAVAKGNRQFRIKIDANGGIVRLGGAQILISPADVDLTDRPFRRGSHPSALWQVGMNYMAAYSDPVPSYTLKALDYYRQNPALYPNEEFVMGGLVDGYDAELAETFTQRITRLRTVHDELTNTTLGLGAREPDIVQRLAGRA